MSLKSVALKGMDSAIWTSARKMVKINKEGIRNGNW